MKIFKRILLFIIVVILLSGLAVYLWLTNPFVHIPSLGKDLPPNFEEARQVFKERVSNSYQAGSPEKDLIEDLLEQKFKLMVSDKIDGDLGKATYRYSQFPCRYNLSVVWRSSNGLITNVNGSRWEACL